MDKVGGLLHLLLQLKKGGGLSSGNFYENNSDVVVRSTILEHMVNSIYWVSEKFICVFCSILMKNPNELFG